MLDPRLLAILELGGVVWLLSTPHKSNSKAGRRLLGREAKADIVTDRGSG